MRTNIQGISSKGSKMDEESMSIRLGLSTKGSSKMGRSRAPAGWTGRMETGTRVGSGTVICMAMANITRNRQIAHTRELTWKARGMAKAQ